MLLIKIKKKIYLPKKIGNYQIVFDVSNPLLSWNFNSYKKKFNVKYGLKKLS